MSQSSPQKSIDQGAIITGRRIAKRYYKSQSKRIQKYECKRLKKMIPSLSQRSHVSQLTVIEEATRHIAQLEQAVLQRLQPESSEKTVSDGASPQGEDPPNETAQAFLRSILPANFLDTVLRGRPIVERHQSKRYCHFPLPRSLSTSSCALKKPLL